MSNPLLRPDDRFQRPSLTDAEGRSFFADDTPPPAPSRTNEAPLAAPTVEANQAGPSYQPLYETVLPHRANSWFVMSLFGFLATWGLVLPFFTIYAGYGIILGFLGVILSIIAALQSFQELTGMSRGAIDPAGRNLLVIAYCLAMGGVVIGMAVMAWVIILVYQGVMELNL